MAKDIARARGADGLAGLPHACPALTKRGRERQSRGGGEGEGESAVPHRIANFIRFLFLNRCAAAGTICPLSP